MSNVFRVFFTFSVLLSFIGFSYSADSPYPSSKSTKYGKKLLYEFDVSPGLVMEFESYLADMKKNPKANDFSPTPTWSGKEISLDPGGSPYTIVATVTATAIADGDATSLFSTGWSGIGNTGKDHFGFLPGINKFGAKANERFTVTAAAPPLSFKNPETITPVFFPVKSSNMSISAVHIQVWSGVAGMSFPEWFGMIPLTGLVALLLWWFLYKRNA